MQESLYFDPYFNRFTLTTLPNLPVVEFKVPTFSIVLIDSNEVISPGRFRLGFLRLFKILLTKFVAVKIFDKRFFSCGRSVAPGMCMTILHTKFARADHETEDRN